MKIKYIGKIAVIAILGLLATVWLSLLIIPVVTDVPPTTTFEIERHYIHIPYIVVEETIYEVFVEVLYEIFVPVPYRYYIVPPMFELLGDDFRLTIYCSCTRCTGANNSNRQRSSWGHVIVETASGAIAVEGVTVAVDPAVIPLGSKIYVEGFGVRVAQDTGSGVNGNHVDIFFRSHYPLFMYENRRVWLINEGMEWLD